jgi:hypothetical protein
VKNPQKITTKSAPPRHYNPEKKYIFVQKRIKLQKIIPFHVVQEGESMADIAQFFYGIKTEKLYKMNQLPFTEGAQVGQVLKLR